MLDSKTTCLQQKWPRAIYQCLEFSILCFPLSLAMHEEHNNYYILNFPFEMYLFFKIYSKKFEWNLVFFNTLNSALSPICLLQFYVHIFFSLLHLQQDLGLSALPSHTVAHNTGFSMQEDTQDLCGHFCHSQNIIKSF